MVSAAFTPTPANLWWQPQSKRCALCRGPGLTPTLQPPNAFPQTGPTSWAAPLASSSLQWTPSTTLLLPCWLSSPMAKKHTIALPVYILNLTGCYGTCQFFWFPPRWYFPWWGAQSSSMRAGLHQKRQRRRRTSPSRGLWAHSQR